jgi:hypothetical protein
MPFDERAVARVLADLQASFAANVLGPHAPDRPDALAHDRYGAGATPAATSTGQALTAAPFGMPPVHIPIAGGSADARRAYKSELVLFRDPAVGTQKVLWWHSRDPRDAPHNHPWDFRSAILAGGYEEERYWIDEGGRLRTERLQWRAGEINVMPADVFHNVVAVAPGTVTYLDCGPSRAGNAWGYLDTDTLAYHPFNAAGMTPDDFMDAFRAINPYMTRR